MTLAVTIFGLFVAALGITGVFSPSRVLDLVSRLQSQSGLYWIAGFRLLIGAVLLLGARASRAPLYLQILGSVSLVSGCITPFFGVHRFGAVLQWWRERAALTVRLWSWFVVLFGLSLVWAVLPGP